MRLKIPTLNSCRVYLAPLCFIAGWWYCVFALPSPSNLEQVRLLARSEVIETPLGELLSDLSRDKLKLALSGDFDLMSRLIAEWDQDAQIMESQGYYEALRLPRQEYVRAVTLSRSLKNNKTAKKQIKKYYPQSWNSASFLLALAGQEAIAALPEGYKPPYPLPNLKVLRGDHGEKLWSLSPDGAFLASYTHPAVVQTLKELKIPYHTSKAIFSLEGINDEILMMGRVVEKEKEAELLTIFIKSALLAIDGRARLLPSYDHTYYLSSGSYLSYPTKKMISGQLADRLKLNQKLPDASLFAWKVPIDKETLTSLNPKRLILSCENIQSFSLPDYQGPIEIALIEQASIECLDQFVVLAYYDLYEALTR